MEWTRLLVEARSTKISFYEGAAVADSVMPTRCRSSRRGAAARLRSAVSTVVRSVTVAAGVFAPGHLGELTRQARVLCVGIRCGPNCKQGRGVIDGCRQPHQAQAGQDRDIESHSCSRAVVVLIAGNQDADAQRSCLFSFARDL